MKSAEIPWPKGMLLICSKCEMAIDKDKLKEPKDIAEHIRDDFRKRLKEKGLHKSLRVIVSGCIDVCHKGKQAAAFVPGSEQKHLASTVEVLTLHPEKDREALFAKVLARLEES